MPQLPIKPIALILLVALLVSFSGSSPSEPVVAFSGTPPTVGTSTSPATTQRVTTIPPATTVPAVTVPPTTAPPATVPPTTVPPTTVATTTIPPTTIPPTTIPPTTVAPTTVAPTTAPPTTVPATTVPEGLSLVARNAFVYHCGSGQYDYVKGNLNDTLYPASITKLFSIYVGLMYLQPEQMITVGDIINTVPADSSFAYISVGNQLTVEQLMAGMLLPSGNDAAQVWAVEAGRAAAGDPSMTQWAAREYFIEEMNRQAALLGLTHSHFLNPDGYHAYGHHTSMADLCKIAQLCLANPLIRSISSMAKYTVTLGDKEVTWNNTNWLLSSASPYYHPNVIGLKTGSTGAAGSCVLAVFHTDGEDVIVGIFGSESYDTRFQDALALYNEYG